MSIDELNEIAAGGEFDEFVRVCEARQVKALSHIADDVCARGGVRVVLLAGGSSAGKTTTAKRLCTQLRVNGRKALHLSTDDYFVGDARNPRDENGELDYETVKAVDAERLAADMTALFGGKAVNLRKFDFARHDGYDSPKATMLAEGGIVVLEGIHALNPELTEGIEDRVKFRLFIEPKTQPELFATTTLRSEDARLMRRIVRDSLFRRVDAEETFRMWPKVLAGEKKWILPFRPFADAEFDSALGYELCVLKNYVLGPIEKVRMEHPDESKAEMLSELLSAITAMPPVSVPGNSILRETIGGSQLEY